jgi:hypothetical protein
MKLVIYVLVINFIFSLSFENTVEEKETEKIFIAEGNLKHHKERKQYSNAIAPTYNAGSINDAISKKLQTTSNILETAGISKQTKNYSNDYVIGNGPIYFSAWVKYFKYKENDINISNTPKTFILNNAFIEQSKLFPDVDLNEKDTDGKWKYIRDSSSFWVNVFADSINFINSKQVIFCNIANISNYL